MGPSSNSYFQIFRLPVTGGTPEQITFDPTDKTQPSYSPSGDRIVFYSLQLRVAVLDPGSLRGAKTRGCHRSK